MLPLSAQKNRKKKTSGNIWLFNLIWMKYNENNLLFVSRWNKGHRRLCMQNVTGRSNFMDQIYRPCILPFSTWTDAD